MFEILNYILKQQKSNRMTREISKNCHVCSEHFKVIYKYFVNKKNFDCEIFIRIEQLLFKTIENTFFLAHICPQLNLKVAINYS